MRFLAKINRNYLMLLSVMFLIISISGYFIIEFRFEHETKEKLEQTAYLIHEQIRNTDIFPNLYPIIIIKKSDNDVVQKRIFRDVYLHNEGEEDEDEPYIELLETVKINGFYYQIKLRHSMFEAEDMIMAIAYPLLALLLSAFLISYFINKKTNKNIWCDFEQNLNAIENYSFNQLKKLTLKKSSVVEFARLNDVITNLTRKLNNDYQLLKRFTENSSHEIQTPIAIILLNLEELLQHNINEQAAKQVVTAINSVKRLSSLNKSLVLLTKIENKQFPLKSKLSLNKIIRSKITDFAPLLENSDIKIIINANEDFNLQSSNDLMDILINNLLSNAIRHNKKGGSIQIDIDKNTITICNTGNKNNLSNNTIFNRFTKENSQSYGLGLAIVKQICSECNLQITYHKQSDLHCFIIKKKN